MRALGRRGPGIFPKQFGPLLDGKETRLWPSFRTWVERAAAGDIVATYEASRSPGTRGYLCYRVGRRGLHAALPMLLHALNGPDSRVRYEAADALGRIGEPSTGYDLFKRYAVEDDLYVLQSLTWGLGYTGFRPAIPVLIDALAEADPCRRAWAAAALAALGATEALPALRQALAREEASDWVKGHMRGAIDELAGG